MKEMGWELGDKLALNVVHHELHVSSVTQATRDTRKMAARPDTHSMPLAKTLAARDVSLPIEG
jgi:hypothetical protein